MKPNTKSSITLLANELALINEIKKKKKFKSYADTLREVLNEYKNNMDREALIEQYRKASNDLRDNGTREELEEFDYLVNEGLD